MKLSFSQIKDIALGASWISEGERGICFHRFPREQEQYYKAHSSDFYSKALSSSGIKLRFRTDSESLSMKVSVSRGSSRKYFSFDVFVNGEMKTSFNNFSDCSFSGDYTRVQLPLGEFSFETELGEGEKEVCIYFPWSVKVALRELSLDGGAFVLPVKYKACLVAYGDSITQGYDALYPSRKYITRLSELLCAEEHNRAIGAELFPPQLLLCADNVSPEYVTVAYGTNDWFRCTREELERACRETFDNVRKSYTSSKVIVITPIWRRDMYEPSAAGDFLSVCGFIKEEAEKRGFHTVNGMELVPRDEKLFADLFLHPNDLGFDRFYQSLEGCIGDIE